MTTQTENTTELWTAREVARRLRCTVRHLSNLVKSAGFPRPVRLGRSIRWRPQDVADFIERAGKSDNEHE